MAASLVDRIEVLRSKNAGPFVLTLDVIFGRAADFRSIQQRLDRIQVAAAYGIDPADVLGIDFVPELNAMKISVRRARSCGHPGDPDCYGMNQEQPLALLLDELVLG